MEFVKNLCSFMGPDFTAIQKDGFYKCVTVITKEIFDRVFYTYHKMFDLIKIRSIHPITRYS